MVMKMTPAHLALLKNINLEEWKAKRLIVGGGSLDVRTGDSYF